MENDNRVVPIIAETTPIVTDVRRRNEVTKINRKALALIVSVCCLTPGGILGIVSLITGIAGSSPDELIASGVMGLIGAIFFVIGAIIMFVSICIPQQNWNSEKNITVLEKIFVLIF